MLYIGDLNLHVWSKFVPEEGVARPMLRAGPAMTVSGRHLIVYGGVDLVTREYFNDVWAFDLRSQVWHLIDAEERPGVTDG